MRNDQKISTIKYDWETVSLDVMRKKYFERIINIFSMFEIVVTMDLVRTTFLDIKINHITALLIDTEIRDAWIIEYGYEPTSEDAETLHELLKTIEENSAKDI